MKLGFRITAASVLAVFTAASVQWPALAQQPTARAAYRLGVGDRIYMSVRQRPDLSRELVVGDGGVVSIPLIGDVNVEGATLDESRVKLLQAMRDYYPSITGIDLTIREAVSQAVYVSGQVTKPGKYTFSSTPNLWDAIREAGGPSPTASMDLVRVVKDRSKGGRSQVFNVQAALETGSVDDLPDLEAGDTVIVPAVQVAYTGAFGVNVFGAVVRPGVYRLQSRKDLVSAILAAGGPTETAALDKIQIIRPLPSGGVQTINVDLEKFLEDGDPLSNPKLIGGDTISLPKKGGISQLFRTNVGLVFDLVTTAATLVALVITIRERNPN